MNDLLSALFQLLALCLSSWIGFGVTLLAGATLSWILQGPLGLSLLCTTLGLLALGLGILLERRV